MTTEDKEQQCRCDRHLWVTTGFGFTQRVRCIVCDTNYHPNKEGVSVRVQQFTSGSRFTSRHLLGALTGSLLMNVSLILYLIINGYY